MPRSVDYDQVASGYDRRYRESRYPGIERVLEAFAEPGQSVLEVGCGTGHWIAALETRGCAAVGVEPSHEMLRQARSRVGAASLVRGRAEVLPFRAASLQRVAVVNALHHFEDPVAFVVEARRVLQPGGRIVVLGLDPSRGTDTWFVYDFFGRTRELDRMRYPSTRRITGWFEAAGFVGCATEVGEHLTFDLSARVCLDRGVLTKDSTSQLSLLDDREFEAGMDELRTAVEAAESRGQDIRLRGDLRIHATFGTVPR